MPVENIAVTETPAPAAPASTPSPAPVTESVSSPPPTTTPSDTGSTPTASTGASAPATPSWLDGFRSQGIDLGSDEAAARTRIADAIQRQAQLEPMMPYVQSYMANAQRFSQWMQQQGQERQQPHPGQPQQQAAWWSEYWNPPEYSQSWERLVQRDPQTGAVVPAPGAPPDVVPKFLAYQQYRAEQAERFLQNPFKFMEDGIRKLIRDESSLIVNNQLGQHSDAQTSQRYVEQNAAWLYDRDDVGNVKFTQVFNPMTGQQVRTPVLSRYGEVFRAGIEEKAAEQNRRGYQDVNEQRLYAEQRVQLAEMQDRLHWLQQGGGAVAGGAPAVTQQSANAAFLAKNNPPSNVPPTTGNTNAASPPVTRKNLREQLAADMAAAGFMNGTVAAV